MNKAITLLLISSVILILAGIVLLIKSYLASGSSSQALTYLAIGVIFLAMAVRKRHNS